jgi:hypothetical protein
MIIAQFAYAGRDGQRTSLNSPDPWGNYNIPDISDRPTDLNKPDPWGRYDVDPASREYPVYSIPVTALSPNLSLRKRLYGPAADFTYDLGKFLGQYFSGLGADERIRRDGMLARYQVSSNHTLNSEISRIITSFVNNSRYEKLWETESRASLDKGPRTSELVLEALQKVFPKDENVIKLAAAQVRGGPAHMLEFGEMALVKYRELKAKGKTLNCGTALSGVQEIDGE